MASVRQWIGIWEKYFVLSRGLTIKYEALLDKPSEVVEQIISYLGLDVHADQVQDILWKYSKQNTLADITGLHFNKAVAGRYKSELSGEQLNTFKEKLGEKIVKMGYEI